jgi:hypothetical protein
MNAKSNILPTTQTNTDQSSSNSNSDVGIASSTDDSDAALSQDMNTVDSQMNGLNTDASNVDASLQQ